MINAAICRRGVGAFFSEIIAREGTALSVLAARDRSRLPSRPLARCQCAKRGRRRSGIDTTNYIVLLELENPEKNPCDSAAKARDAIELALSVDAYQNARARALHRCVHTL